MWGGLFKARLNAARKALSEGRLEEAWRIAGAADLQADSQGQQLRTQIGQQFFVRAEQRFQQQDSAGALIDLILAEQAGVAVQRIHDLRTIIQGAAEHLKAQRADQQQVLRAAEARLANGSLYTAREILHQVPQADGKVQDLHAEMEQRELRAAALLKEVAEHAGEQRWGLAINRLAEARRLHAKSPAVVQWESRLQEVILQRVQEALVEGRLPRAIEEFNWVVNWGGHSGQREVALWLSAVHEAGAAVRSHDYESARRKLLAVRHALPQAKWLDPICEQLAQVEELITQLHGGPLGIANGELNIRKEADQQNKLVVTGRSLDDTVAMVQRGGEALPSRLLMMVDGAGSYLLVRGLRATIGRAAGRTVADIPLLADLAEVAAEIIRAEEDYFLVAREPVNVSGQPVTRKLLQNGDKIILGKRAKLTFILPSRKSTTAVLEASESTRLPRDVRRVVLMDRLVTLGPTSTSQLLIPSMREEMVLMERGGRMFLRSPRVMSDGGQEVVVGRSLACGDVNVVVQSWPAEVA
ncbi:MAG: hypothetical protein HJJLKODD_00938 [Phycisphaerae bacterium]|nr:hypothetical protein [Phycisphaerae bacterium]